MARSKPFALDYSGDPSRLPTLFENTDRMIQELYEDIASAGSGVSALKSLSDVSIPAPTDGQVLTYNGTSKLWVASTPATPASSFNTLVTPNDALYSWVNQGTASVTVTASKGIYLLAPALAGDNLRIRDMAAPATPYTLTAAFIPSLPNINFAGGGLCFRESSSGKIVTCTTVWDSVNGNRLINSDKFTNPTTFSANYIRQTWTPVGAYLWLRIQDNGTNRIFSFSFDGFNFRVAHTVGRTDFLTADRIGFYVNASQATLDAATMLVSWSIT